MTRKHLQWTDVRPTHLRAVSRSGGDYQIIRCETSGWNLYRFDERDPNGTLLNHGALADMKALAEAAEEDRVGQLPTPQRIQWTKIRDGHYWGVAPIGLAYRVLKVGIADGAAVWRLEQFANEDAEHGAPLDEGSLQSLKRRAEQDATAAARATPVSDTGGAGRPTAPKADVGGEA